MRYPTSHFFAGIIVAALFLFQPPSSAASGCAAGEQCSPLEQRKIESKKKKKPSAAKLPRISITYTGIGSATLFSENKGFGQSMPCRVDKLISNELVDLVNWQSFWNNVSIATRSGIPATVESPFNGNRIFLNEEYADLTNCPPFQLNDCKRQDPACLTFQEYCSASALIQRQPSKLLVRKVGKLYEITVSAESFLEVLGFDPFNFSACSRTSLFDNPIIDGKFGSLTRAKFLVKPHNKVRRTFIPVRYVPQHDCSDPAVQAIKFDYTCIIQNKLQGGILVVGKWTVVSKFAKQ